MIQDYAKAKKLGEKAYRKAVLRGQYPYLPSLEDMVSEIDQYPEIGLGLAEIPLDMIVGTRTSGRQNAFAVNFMPLMEEHSEFADKWSRLYDAQVEEGIRDPVKAYEFLNRFYVEEGNKRVSVLRYVGAVSVHANVIRIRPPRVDTEQSRLYYEYLDFYRVTRSLEIVMSKPGSYLQLARILEQDLVDPWPEDLLEKLHSAYIAFKMIYLGKGGGRLSLTAADALLIYLGIYSLDSLLRESSGEIEKRLLRLWKEFIVASSPEGIALIEHREEAEKKAKPTPIGRAAKIVEKTVEKTSSAGVTGAADLAGAFAGITVGPGAAEAARKAVKSSLETVLPAAAAGSSAASAREAEKGKYSPAHPLRIAFIHEKDARFSSWVYGHELGRNHLKEAFGSLVETRAYENCRTEDEIRSAFGDAAAQGCRMIFATAPNMAREALRLAVENPGVRVLSCGINQSKQAVRFYFGKMYEAKFLMGALAASLTDDHRIGYISGRSDPAAFANINAFALGAQIFDPYCRIELQWLPDSVSSEGGRAMDAGERRRIIESLLARGRIHVISDIDMVRPEEGDRKYGLYLCDEAGGLKRLAAPIWDWGVFYEIVVRKMLDGSYDKLPAEQKDRAMNYWLGISSGLIDIIYSDDLPRPSYRLLKMLTKEITDGRVQPFAGVIVDQSGNAHGTEDGVLSNAEVISMDWLAENVDGDRL